jgi:hypothetical protein
MSFWCVFVVENGKSCKFVPDAVIKSNSHHCSFCKRDVHLSQQDVHSVGEDVKITRATYPATLQFSMQWLKALRSFTFPGAAPKTYMNIKSGSQSAWPVNPWYM